MDHPIIEFNDNDHSYYDIETGERYVSVTQFIGMFKPKQDWNAIAEKYAKKHGETAEYWIAEWDRVKNEACYKGTKYHEGREDLWVAQEDEGKLVYTNKLNSEGKKRSRPINNLEEGIHSELIVYHPGYGICGQSDEIRNRLRSIRVNDYKTNKKIDKESYFNWKTRSHNMMTGPVSHIMDSNYWHYALQTSTYAYFMECYGYQVDHLSIEHVTANNEMYFLPYLREEVIDMLNYYDENKCNL